MRTEWKFTRTTIADASHKEQTIWQLHNMDTKDILGTVVLRVDLQCYQAIPAFTDADIKEYSNLTEAQDYIEACAASQVAQVTQYAIDTANTLHRDMVQEIADWLTLRQKGAKNDFERGVLSRTASGLQEILSWQK